MRDRRRRVAAVIAGALLASSLVVVGAEPASATTCSAASIAVWGASCSQSVQANGTLKEDVVYTPPGRPAVGGVVCRPDAPGTYPVIVFNHAANANIGDLNEQCAGFALQVPGHVVLISNYRPNSVNAANSPYCVGQVDDVVGMIDLARWLPFVDDGEITMRGESLGACVTLRIHQMGLAGLHAAAAINPPTDMAAVHSNSVQRYNASLCVLLPIGNCAAWDRLRDDIAAAAGGPPGPTTDAVYDAGSPVELVSGTVASTVPLMVIQGAADPLIPIAQTCAFAKAVNDVPGGAWDFTPVRFGSQLSGWAPNSTAPASCPGMGSWANGDPQSTNPVPANRYPGDRYLLVYDGLQHATPSTEYSHVLLEASYFILTR